MLYLQDPDRISRQIAQFTEANTLWVDTEVADFRSRQPRLSLIQLLDDPQTQTSDRVFVLDVLDRPEMADFFIDQIMLNPAIEKVFHQARYDLKYLGKTKAKNVTCTLEMAKQIPYYILPLPDLSLKTLAETLCQISTVDKTQQASDWGQRPLTTAQLDYAGMDPVYLAMVHQQLLQLQQLSQPEPVVEDVTILTARYVELKQQLQMLSSEFEHIETRLKSAMQAQRISETDQLKLSASNRQTTKVDFTHLAQVIAAQGLDLNFPITLTQKLQKQLGDTLAQLALQVETSTSWRLAVKERDGNQADDEF